MREDGEYLQVLSPWKPKEKEKGGSFYLYFYPSDQRFGAHSAPRVVTKYDFKKCGFCFLAREFDAHLSIKYEAAAMTVSLD